MKNVQKAIITLSAILLAGSILPLAASAKQSSHAKENRELMATVKEIDSVESLAKWMTYYYLHPQPELLVPALLFADKQGLLKGDSAAPLQAFTSRVFAQNPDKIKEWFTQLGPLSENGKTLILTAIWWSGTKQGKDLLDAISSQLAEKPKAEFKKQIDKEAPEIDKMEIESPDVLDMLWGCFSATGDEKYVKRLLSTLTWGKADSKDLPKMLIASAARWSLISNIDQHPRVKEICESIQNQDTQLKPYLEKVLQEATAKSTQQAELKESKPASKSKRSADDDGKTAKAESNDQKDPSAGSAR